jgi:acetyl-CoA acetyltransferase
MPNPFGRLGDLAVTARIVAAAESPYQRHASTTTEELLADAFIRVLQSAGIDRSAVDGLGLASFTLAPDHVADLSMRLGVRPRWLMEDTNGGASALNMLQHALRAVESGDATTIVLLAGDHFTPASFRHLVDSYNSATARYLAPIPHGGPNALFALITQSHMDKHGLSRDDYGRLVIAQRHWAQKNPRAVYREPMTMDQYLASPVVAEPLHRYDCAPVVSGADAVVFSSADSGVAVRSLKALHNADLHEGDGLRTGLAEIAGELWDASGFGPEDIDAAYVYDDYPVMIAIQLDELGLVPESDIARFAQVLPLPVNTSGGQLSAGQAGAGGGMHGLVEAVNQLRKGDLGLKRVVVTGYGMVLYRYGACANAAVLEAV